MSIAEEMQSLVQEIARSHEERVKGIAQLREEVKAELVGRARSREAVARELRGELAKVRPALAKEEGRRQSEAREFKGELSRAVTEGKAAVAAQLRGLHNAHQAMSRELRTHLAGEERERLQEAGQFRGELRREVAQGKAAAQARLKEFATVQAGAREAWQNLTTLRARRGVAVAEEEAIAKAQAVEVTPELAALKEKVFAFLANHPDGTRMTELEREFGLARIQMARVVRSLVEENKVEKRGLLYFAI